MKAGPELRSLSLRHFFDFSYIEDNRIVLPSQRELSNYIVLPENKVTKLDLQKSWFTYDSLKQLLSHFQNLQDFRFAQTEWLDWDITANSMVRSVDAHDVVTLLEPFKQQLEVLDLNFTGFPGFYKLEPTRPIRSLAAFTTLKSVRLEQACLGMPPKPDVDDISAMSEEEIAAQRESEIAYIKTVLVNLLPCKSLEFLQIDEFSDEYDYAVVELARHASLERYPNLKHVRLIGKDHRYFMNDEFGEDNDLGECQNLKSLVPPECWKSTRVVRAIFDYHMDYEARGLFLKAGVKFEGLQLNWLVKDKEDVIIGWMQVYPQHCAGRCADGECLNQAN
ncbi:hypothetical protein diail_2300 [Diaporthe ilicicola]|nr:hypothetical protein diail_2300 [Diaporthe ilicicola]